MEASLDPRKLNQDATQQKGGLRTMPFIIANESFERVASFGLLPNMILYLTGVYHMSVPTSVTVLSLWSAASNFLPWIGAFISDSYLGRYRTIVLGCFVSLLGMILLWFTSMIPQARPPYCDTTSQNCISATPTQLTLLLASFVLMSIGAGGIRPCSIAFGADQLNQEDNPNNKRVLQSFFNWYYASITVSIMIAMTVIVYIQVKFGWIVGFGVPVVLMAMSVVFFLLASSFYVKTKANNSLFSGFAQTTVASIKNRYIILPPETGEGSYHYTDDSKMTVPSEKLRFLNKACVIRNHKKDLDSEGLALNPWSLCTVEQVEELKALLKVLPLWSTGIILAVTISQQSFPLLQANSMNRYLTSNFQIPAGSFGMFSIIALTLWIAVYDRLVVPQLAKVTGKPQGIGHRQRMGIGLVLSVIAMGISAIVENFRRETAIKQGFAENPQGVVDMSAMWLVPQYVLVGLAEAFNAIGQIEFYYAQFPKSMSSVASALFGLGSGFGNLLVSLIVKIVDHVTKSGGKESWVSSNINKGRYDYYYGLLTFLSAMNFVYFLVCCWAYGHGDEERCTVQNEDEDIKEY
ncbi:hypothetical protein ACHQM5_002139 [Ranunculus cassubicifolius]